MSLNRKLNKFYMSDSCYIHNIEDGASTQTHTHDFLEIVYIFRGNGTHYIDDVSYTVGPGDALFINYGSTHSFLVAEKMHYVDILIKPEYISESLKGVENAFALLELDSFKDFEKIVPHNNRLMHFSMSERQQLENLILLIYAEQNAANPGKPLALRSLYNILLIFFFRKLALPIKLEIGIGNELLQHIRSRCAEPLSLEKIAADHHYNPAYFSRLFKQQTGYTFTQYVTECRIDLACQLLSDTELNVADIAVQAGFSDRTKFYQIFASKVGMTPRQYRKSKK